MDGFQEKNKIQFYLYELIGTAILSMIFNLTDSGNGLVGDLPIAGVLFILTFVAWEVGAAHFNMALTLGSFAYSSTDGASAISNLLPCVLTLFSQFVGGLLGILLTRASSKRTYPIPNDDIPPPNTTYPD